MSQRLNYWRLEVKRAFFRLPQLAAGAVILTLFLGLTASFAGERLYGDSALGRITIGVILSGEDEQEKCWFRCSPTWKVWRASVIFSI